MSIAEHFKKFQQRLGESRPDAVKRNEQILAQNGLSLAFCSTGRNDEEVTTCVVFSDIFLNGYSRKEPDQTGYYYLYTFAPDNFRVDESVAAWQIRRDGITDIYINPDLKISTFQREIAVAYVLDRVSRIPNCKVQLKTRM